MKCNYQRVNKMKKNEIDKAIEEYTTCCCSSGYYKKMKMEYRCKKCDKDVTMEIFLLYEALADDCDMSYPR